MSKKVDDISKHESKHDTDPKHDPKTGFKLVPDVDKKPGANEQQGRMPSHKGTRP